MVADLCSFLGFRGKSVSLLIWVAGRIQLLSVVGLRLAVSWGPFPSSIIVSLWQTLLLSLPLLRAQVIKLVRIHPDNSERSPKLKICNLNPILKFFLQHKVTHSQVLGVSMWRYLAGHFSAYYSNKYQPHPPKISTNHREQPDWPRPVELYIGLRELWESINKCHYKPENLWVLLWGSKN